MDFKPKKIWLLIIAVLTCIIQGCNTIEDQVQSDKINSPVFSSSSSSWPYPLINWEGRTYEITSQVVEQVGKELGRIEIMSDIEGTYIGIFSNELPKGTRLFEIPQESPLEAIAYETEEGDYYKAVVAR
jgi:hypothetical protein